ncbi:MAG: hypothetical protein ACRDUY_14985, partial [Nitriliruptorales bacterium]
MAPDEIRFSQYLNKADKRHCALRYPFSLRFQVAGRLASPEVRTRPAVLNVLPRSVAVEARGDDGDRADVVVAGQPLRIHWAGEGNLGDVRRLAARRKARPDIVVARRLSPASRQLLSEAGIGWVDETGAAEIAIGTLVVSRTGRPQPTDGLKGWTPAVLAVAEALLCGVRATVSATEEATGLSTGSCTAALRFLTDEGLLVADAERGRRSARRVQDPDRVLDAYTRAARAEPSGPRLQVSLLGKDLLDELAATGRTWDRHDVLWAATGAAAASVLAPHLTSVSSIEVYVDADTVGGLENGRTWLTTHFDEALSPASLTAAFMADRYHTLN